MNLIDYTVKIPDTDIAREAVDSKVIDIIDAHERAEAKRLKDMPKPKESYEQLIENENIKKLEDILGKKVKAENLMGMSHKEALKESIESSDSIAENYEGMDSNEEKPARKRRTKAEMEASDK